MGPRHPRILMLGWEYPPRVAGGLGKASQGLARGLAALGATVDFVLPRAPWREDAPALAVGGVRAWLAHGDAPRRARAAWPRSGLNVFTIPSDLHPYARPHDDGVAGPASTWPEAEPDFADPLYGHDLGREVARFADEVVALAPRLDVELVHANDWMSFPAAFAAARARHLPVFLHVHSTEYDRSGEAVNPFIADIERQAFAHAAHVFAVSRYTARTLATRYGVPAERISVVYNAPDAGERRIQAMLPAKRAPWVVFLGRLTFQKGPDHFLQAVAQVARLRPDARFLVCGSGDMADGLRRLADTLGIAERVVFTGFLGPAAVERVLAQARVLVMPSVSEPFGLVALEALGLGTPVIVSRQSGVREVLGHALEVDFWDHDKLADQILAVLRLPALDTQLVETGGAALAQLSWEASAARILDTCRRVAGTPGVGP